MKNSGISSSNTTRATAPTAQRSSFSLKGRSVQLDPTVNAVRGDLADIRLAEYVFAPHYAAPLAMAVVRSADLLAGPAAEAEILCRLDEGETVEVLDIASGYAWGIAAGRAIVGYVARDALVPIDPAVAPQ